MSQHDLEFDLKINVGHSDIFHGPVILPYILKSCVSLTLCCFVVCSTRRFVLCLTQCHFVPVFFNPFSIAITSLGEERANLSAFRSLFDLCLFGFVGFLFLLVSGKGCGL